MSGGDLPRKNLFPNVRPELDFPRDEAEILSFWKGEKIFEKTLSAETRATGPSKGTFVFYEGPPTANGMPHNGHVLTRAVKDVFPRFKTMRGYDVPRKAGWDTHGLPVEVEVEKELRIHGKADIERYGVESFVSRCIESVFQYTDAWEKLTDKIGFWVDLPDAYVTYHRSYVESVWWALAKLFEKGLLYQGHKVVWWWAQGGTALSSAEVGQGYKTVDDPSVFVAFPLVGEPDTALCVWTTTPWTLSSNMYAAVRADFEYAVVDAGDRKLVVAAGLREALAKKLGKDLPVLSTCKGSDLVGKKYVAPFDIYAAEAASYEAIHAVVAADFVTLDAGTGIVHVAPAFGEDDYGVHRALLSSEKTITSPFCAVEPDGTFVAAMGKFAGRWVKDADRDLTKELEASGKLVHAELYRHEYPFCWRSDDDPLIQYARPAWYIRTTALIDRAIANSQVVNWLPEHIKTGRFGDFLANNVDWALSRERYWGTPLPIWVNDETGAIVAVDSVASLRAKPGNNVADVERELAETHPDTATHLLVHKPWIDKITFTKEGEAGTYRRVSEVIDCWFDSGAMPFAQWGFPHVPGSKEKFDRAFPADFISEAIDQTRGWFYSLLMISTLVFDEETQKELGLSAVRGYPHPYKTCVVLGHVGDREGKKESKSKGNYTPPEIILDRVRMEFAATNGEMAKVGVVPEGVALVAREDYEGLDLTGDSARVRLYRGDRVDGAVTLELKPATGKLKLPRRIVALSNADLDKLGLEAEPDALRILPKDVPRLPQDRRVFVEDPGAPAPGADAFRWFFYASSPPWTNTRHSLTNVRATQKEYAIKIRNVWSFFVIYANIDGFDPARGNADARGVSPSDLAKSEGYRPAKERSLLDRWVSSELAIVTRDVTQHLESYRLYEAAQALVDFVDGLSNWYVRRSRSRFWSPAEDVSAEALQDKRDAYFTLYEALVCLAHLTAPFTPFFAEELYQSLVRSPWSGASSQPSSVHLASYPEPDLEAIDEDLAAEMRAVRELVSLGLQVRTQNKLKVRQPLSRADVVVSNQGMREALKKHEALIAEELNVREVCFLEPGQEGEAVRYVLKPNFRALGPKLGKKVQLAKQVLAKADAASLRTELVTRGAIEIEIDGERVSLGPAEIEVVVEAGKDFAAAGGRAGVVVLHTALTDSLRDEGLAREILSRVQGLRKELNLGFTDRILLGVEGSDRILRVTRDAQIAIASEALVHSFSFAASLPDADRRDFTIDGEPLTLSINRASRG